MRLKKIIAAVSACAVAALSMAAMTVNVGAAAVVGKAIVAGQMGVYTQWDTSAANANGSTIAEIDGNAQYEATWNITGSGASSIDMLMLEISGADTNNADIKDFTSTKYPNLSISIDEVWIDGIKIMSYTTSADATDYNYYQDNLGKARVYLSSNQATPKLCQDIQTNTAVTQQVRVVFTVSGLDTVGTSNVTESPLTTESTTPPTEAATTEALIQDPLITTDDGAQGGFSGAETTVDAATTGDGGVAAIAIAGLAVTAGAAVLSKVKFGRKKKK
ncbi:hypothetical protein [Porcipelethomonas sp.]|uniref:hypothetical protein n=1 Tax=Porcipelethomonas sp. TaxID=2981675 RepID=UPI003EF83569